MWFYVASCQATTSYHLAMLAQVPFFQAQVLLHTDSSHETPRISAIPASPPPRTCPENPPLQAVNKEGAPADWTPPSFRAFLLFTGAAMSFTAFPVLASLLSSAGKLPVHLVHATWVGAAQPAELGRFAQWHQIAEICCV